MRMVVDDLAFGHFQDDSVERQEIVGGRLAGIADGVCAEIKAPRQEIEVEVDLQSDPCGKSDCLDPAVLVELVFEIIRHLLQYPECRFVGGTADQCFVRKHFPRHGVDNGLERVRKGGSRAA